MRCFLSAFLLVSWTLLFGSQSVQETISACLDDLRDASSPEKRRAAVLVLGKYDTSEVTEALGECLADSDVEVRRSALVSLCETPLRLLTKSGAVIECLEDDDVHIRRLASSALDVCLGGVVSGGVRISAGGIVRTQSRSRVMRLLEAGLRDEDEEVRRNVLRALKNGAVAIDFHAVMPFLKDDSPEVVCMAVQTVVNGIGPYDERLKALKPLVHHENAAVRGTLAEALQEVPSSLSLLDELSVDVVEDIRLTALVSRGNMRDINDSGLASEIREALVSGGLKTKHGERLLSLLAIISEEAAWQFVQTVLLDESNAELQETAWLHLLRHTDWQGRLKTAELSAAMSRFAGNQRIRSMLISILRKRGGEIGFEDVKRMLSSPHIPCRKALLELLRSFSEELQARILMELMMDDDVEIRLQTVRQISSSRPAGWEEILIATLEDSDAALQLAAAQGLARGKITSQESRDALRSWLPNCHDAALRLRLERQLMQR